MRVLFFGMTGQFSVPPLFKLLNAGVQVSAIIVPALRNVNEPLPRLLPKSTAMPGDSLPLPEADFKPNVIQLSRQHQVPVWEVGRLSSRKTLTMLRGLQPDVIAVACFPRLFPAELLHLPRYGCLNLHPSLLPAYRGPDPLFWIAYHDERITGVTLHRLNESADSGDIVAQTRFERPDGLSAADLESCCAGQGADLLLTALQQLQQGASLTHRPQDEALASYFPHPTVNDCVIPTHWPARRAYNFIRGAKGRPLSVRIGNACYRIRVAKNYSTKHTLNQPFLLLADELWIQFNPGVLHAKIQ